MIKASLPSSLSFLVTLFNKILQTQIYPEKWSRGIITPIPKSGEIENPDNYRGITINSCLSKLFNLLLINRLLSLINEKNILKNNQIGFRKGFRTADHVLTIKALMNKYLSENKKLYLYFVDFRKAYDSIWHEALFEKLLGYKISTKFVSLLKNVYEKLNLSVRLPRGITEFFPSNVGLKQGCNMNPILFNLFINDINEIFHERFYHPVTLCNIKLSNLLYEDDLILISETRTGLQSCLSNLQAYCQKWKLTVNKKKTKVMVVEKRQFSTQMHRFSFKKEPLEICKLYPYLGTIITNNGNFKVNIQELCKSARRAMYTLLGSTNKYASGNLRMLLKLFDRMILPICTHNCEVCGSTFFTRKFVPNDFLSKRRLKNAADKLHCVFIKQTLGVNSKASNWAILSETNRCSHD